MGTDLLPSDGMRKHPTAYMKRLAAVDFGGAAVYTILNSVFFHQGWLLFTTFGVWIVAIIAFVFLSGRKEGSWRRDNENRARHWPFELIKGPEDHPKYDHMAVVWFRPHYVNVRPVSTGIRKQHMYWNGTDSGPNTVAFPDAKVDDHGAITEYGDAAVFGGPGFSHLPLLDEQASANQRDWVWQLPPAFRPPA